MNEKPFYVFVTGPNFMNMDRVQAALAKLWQRVKAEHPDRVMVIVRMDCGGAPMHANWWATGVGLPLLHIPCPTRPNKMTGADRLYVDGVRRVLSWVKVDVLVAFRNKGDAGRPIDIEVQTCIDECAEEFIKTYIVEV
jgi:hypothetical protein